MIKDTTIEEDVTAMTGATRREVEEIVMQFVTTWLPIPTSRKRTLLKHNQRTMQKERTISSGTASSGCLASDKLPTTATSRSI